MMTMMSNILAFLAAATSFAAAVPPAGTQGRYAMLSCKTSAPPPLVRVNYLYGPTELVRDSEYQWWQLEGFEKDDPKAEPQFQLQALTSRDPLSDSKEPLKFARYILRVPAAGDTLEYRNIHDKQARFPAWHDFELAPHPSRVGIRRDQFPESCLYLGHLLNLHQVEKNVAWKPFASVKVLDLDPELLVGTPRAFKDKEGHRLPPSTQPKDYTYVPFVKDDYAVMIEAGINEFTVNADQEQFVRAEPVFYLRNAEGAPPLRYPVDMYRSNYLGDGMFLDEPASILGGEQIVMKYQRNTWDIAQMLTRRVHESAESFEYGGKFLLERQLLNKRVNLGDMRLEQSDVPVWETQYYTTFYQMAGGMNGLVHEGRYQLAEFNNGVGKRTGVKHDYTIDQMLRYYYGYLRGGTRPFGKYWGTSIYGQCDPKMSPRAMTLAYDMGARYLWFWTSDHEHHMPWPEQLELTRTLRKHIAEHPRASIFVPPPTRDLAIAIPYGYFLAFDDPWGGGLANRDKNKELLIKMQKAIDAAYERNEEFDITIDDGREITAYRRVIRVADL